MSLGNEALGLRLLKIRKMRFVLWTALQTIYVPWAITQYRDAKSGHSKKIEEIRKKGERGERRREEEEKRPPPSIGEKPRESMGPNCNRNPHKKNVSCYSPSLTKSLRGPWKEKILLSISKEKRGREEIISIRLGKNRSFFSLWTNLIARSRKVNQLMREGKKRGTENKTGEWGGEGGKVKEGNEEEEEEEGPLEVSLPPPLKKMVSEKDGSPICEWVNQVRKTSN